MTSLLSFPRSCFAAVGLIAATSAMPASAATIYESATANPLALPDGASITSTQYLAVRFDVTSTVTARRLGGNFGDTSLTGNEEIFGAIVSLSAANGFPGSLDPLNTPDVLATTLLDVSGAGINAPLDVSAGIGPVTLTPGTYALVFGSGQFGATGDTYASYNNFDNGTPSYFFSADAGTPVQQWVDGGFDTVRFFVASDVPEPGMLSAIGIVAASVLLRRQRAERSDCVFAH